MMRDILPRQAAFVLALLATVVGFETGATAAVAQYTPTSQQQIQALDQTQPQPGEHPLMPALRIAYAGLKHIDRDIQDYSCTFVKREQVGGVVGEYEYIFMKVRHKPFSVYMYFLGPEDVKGREVIYVEGANGGKMLAHEGQGFRARFGTVSLEPNSPFAMRGQRHSITETGIRNLTRRLIEVGEKDSKYGECEVKFFKGAKLNGRLCTCIQVTHPVPRKQFEFYLARIFIDDELQVPVRYEAYTWPKQPGGPPVLIEEYTHLNLKINNGFTDADFDQRNPNYRFVRR